MSNGIRYGGAELHRVEELGLKMPLAMFGADEALIARNWDWMFPRFADTERHWDMIFQSWIVVVDGKVVVVDPCNGNGRSFPDFPPAHMLDTPYIERFAATGIRPEDVDYVYCTHLHMDHCGWNTELREGRFVPTFPNARYILGKREFDRWDNRLPGYRHVKENAGVFENSVLPVLEAGLADLVPDHFTITQSLTVEPAHGHTLGHSLLHLSSDAREAYFTGDVFHHPLELKHPELDAGSCEDWPATLMARRRIIADCIDRKALIIGAHFPCPFGGWVRQDGEGACFEPLSEVELRHMAL